MNFPSVIRLWILSPKNSSVIFSKSICLCILSMSAQSLFLSVWIIIAKMLSSTLSLDINFFVIKDDLFV